MIRLFSIFLTCTASAIAAEPNLDKCESLSSDTLPRCIEQIHSQKWWEPLSTNLVSAKEAWPGPLRVRFDTSLDRVAKVITEPAGGAVLPAIIFGKNKNPFELVLTLNHELVHYIDLKKRTELISKSEKLKNCLTPYQLATLEDESSAFRAEIEFWRQAPASFKKRLEGIRFNSKLLERKSVNYAEYYRDLERRLIEDRNFVLKKYIELGEYPSCAKGLI